LASAARDRLVLVTVVLGALVIDSIVVACAALTPLFGAEVWADG
jgi:hypothetical protein